jgi:hypothetical protein
LARLSVWAHVHVHTLAINDERTGDENNQSGRSRCLLESVIDDEWSRRRRPLLAFAKR